MSPQKIDFPSVIELYDQSPETRKVVLHNIGLLKCIRGGLRMAERHRISFDPRAEYWRLPERRLAIAYFADRWTGRAVPAPSIRAAGLQIVRDMDRARADGVLSYRGVEREQIAATLPALIKTLQGLPPTAAWQELRHVWPKTAETAGLDVAGFLAQISESDSWDHGFYRRLPWFGYLRSTTENELRLRHAFFYGFANLWTTSNAYIHAGALGFAPVLQNTRSELLLDAALRWASGETPSETGFMTLGRDDEDGEPQDRSGYSSVLEVYGFLNLERVPYYNKLADTYADWFDIRDADNPYELTGRVGQLTLRWLSQNPEAVGRLASLLRDAAKEPWNTKIAFESISSPKLKKRPGATEALLDHELSRELNTTAAEEIARLDEREAATMMLHLLLDSKLVVSTAKPPIVIPDPRRERPIAAPVTRSVQDRKTNRISGDETLIELPATLRPHGDRALSYLKAGLHVLFAGAPGTGKTTLAQFVGHAWDHELDVVPEQMARRAAPLTTVGNSAWSPFHTIGGMVPVEGNRFEVHRGIFIDMEDVSEGAWQLYSGAVVLDEMNRADLDRCIGELYPLLSGSVHQVRPAGLPGTRHIEGNDRFRVIATVNDSNLDDIVFPISEGLARRFQRIELPGASLEDLRAFLRIDDERLDHSRRQAAEEAIERLNDLADEKGALLETEVEPRFPFGVAYLTLLKRWLDRQLSSSDADGNDREQAWRLVAVSLRSLGTRGKWAEIAKILHQEEV